MTHFVEASLPVVHVGVPDVKDPAIADVHVSVLAGMIPEAAENSNLTATVIHKNGN